MGGLVTRISLEAVRGELTDDQADRPMSTLSVLQAEALPLLTFPMTTQGHAATSLLHAR